jgi:hypothetical protein
MKCFRSVVVCGVVVACVFLTGFKKHIPNHDNSTKNKHTTVEVKQQPLDLSVPERNVSFTEPSESLAIVEGSALDALADSNKNKQRAVELNGHVIMSQEPEAGKIKSADGAGIMINLHQ